MNLGNDLCFLLTIPPKMKRKYEPHNLKGDEKASYVAHMFAQISRRYDLTNTVLTGGIHHQWRRLTAQLAAQGLEGNALDIATGTGDLAFALQKQEGILSTVGVDFVPEMIYLATQKAEQRHLSKEIRFLQGDALELPFKDDSFICASSAFGMRNVSDIPSAVSEMKRVVKPNGRVVVLEITPFRKNGIFPRLFRFYFHRLVPIIGKALTGHNKAYTYLPRSVDLFPNADLFASMMEESGLKNVRYHKVGFGALAIHVGEKSV